MICTPLVDSSQPRGRSEGSRRAKQGGTQGGRRGTRQPRGRGAQSRSKIVRRGRRRARNHRNTREIGISRGHRELCLYKSGKGEGKKGGGWPSFGRLPVAIAFAFAFALVHPRAAGGVFCFTVPFASVVPVVVPLAGALTLVSAGSSTAAGWYLSLGTGGGRR